MSTRIGNGKLEIRYDEDPFFSEPKTRSSIIIIVRWSNKTQSQNQFIQWSAPVSRRYHETLLRRFFLEMSYVLRLSYSLNFSTSYNFLKIYCYPEVYKIWGLCIVYPFRLKINVQYLFSITIVDIRSLQLYIYYVLNII